MKKAQALYSKGPDFGELSKSSHTGQVELRALKRGLGLSAGTAIASSRTKTLPQGSSFIGFLSILDTKAAFELLRPL